MQAENQRATSVNGPAGDSPFFRGGQTPSMWSANSVSF
jgi:hypothetical protein